MGDLFYNRFKANLLEGDCNLASGGDTIKVALMDNDHQTGAGAEDNDTWSDVSGNEISGTGYDACGATLANQSVTQDDSNDLAKFDGDDVAWTSASFTAYHAVLYDDTLAGDDLICSFDFGGAQQVTNGTFKIQWNASGVITLS
jgi:hypothetical protein